MNNNVNIAIDGPSGAGKSTLAKAFAAKHGFIYVDTGALYRSIGLYAKNHGVAVDNPKDVIPMLNDIDLKLAYENGTQKVIMNGEDVSGYIRTPEISMYASAVSALADVRAYLLDLQRNIAAENNVVMDGRDIGTVILPNADVKIFLTASPLARAKRRYAELCEKGIKTTLEEVISDMKKRDDNDSSREVAPAVPADDAIFFDNSDSTVEETVVRLEKVVGDKLGYAI